LEKQDKRGGARANAGRKPLWTTGGCQWVVAQVREMIEARLAAKQKRRAEARHPEYGDISESQRLLRAKTPPGSKPDAELLEDIEWHFQNENGGPDLPRYIAGMSARRLAPIEIGKIHEAVAKRATERFGQKVSRRRVKRCIAAWSKLEKAIETD